MSLIADGLKRWVARAAERVAGRFYEGPQPPARIADLIAAWANMHPRATRKDWLEMAVASAEAAYREAWIRGWEHAERDDREPEADPADIADLTEPGWRLHPVDAQLRSPERFVEAVENDPLAMRDALEEHGGRGSEFAAFLRGRRE